MQDQPGEETPLLYRLRRRVGLPKELLPCVLLLSQPLRHVFPAPFYQLPPFLGLPPSQQPTLPPHSVAHFQPPSQSLSSRYGSLKPVYQRFTDKTTEKGTERWFNYLQFNLSKKKLLAEEGPTSSNQAELAFQSRFQSGNLSRAYQFADRQFDLILQNDINTHGYTQWFFFKAEAKTAGRYKLNIVNFYKRGSLFRQGMSLLVTEQKEGVLSWQRGGTAISYFTNDLCRWEGSKGRLQTLSFQFEFRAGKPVYFAYGYPYTYSNLNCYLDSLERTHTPRLLLRTALCATLACNRCDLLTITAPGPRRDRQVVVLCARTHPGQSVSSFVMEGVLDFLVGDQGEQLRKQFVFLVVPMLNPDGVVHGNYRCNLSGADLNRVWDSPDPALHPEVYALKRLVLSVRDKLVFFCDLHGHSKRKNAFVYGCGEGAHFARARAFPLILARLSRDFSFRDSSFELEPDKFGTARIALFEELDLPNIYTLESSFCGSDHEALHYSPSKLRGIGHSLCQALSLYFCVNAPGRSLYLSETTKQLKLIRRREEEASRLPTKKAKRLSSSGSEDEDQPATVAPMKGRTLSIGTRRWPQKAGRQSEGRQTARSVGQGSLLLPTVLNSSCQLRQGRESPVLQFQQTEQSLRLLRAQCFNFKLEERRGYLPVIGPFQRGRVLRGKHA